MNIKIGKINIKQMKHKIENLEIGEYEDGWALSYTFKGFNISMDIEDETITEILKKYYYKYLENKIDTELLKNNPGFYETRH